MRSSNQRAEQRPSEYEVDHLETFISKPRQVLFPEDGLKQLREDELRQTVWTFRCFVAVAEDSVIVVGKQDGAVVEQFSYTTVMNASAIMSDDRRDVYNNLLILTTQESPPTNPREPVMEMHLFQVLSTPAQVIADEINSHRKREKRGSEGSAGRHQQPNYIMPPTPQGARPSGYGESIHSDMEAVDKDRQLLNRCFDDIEIFTARLYQVAEKAKQLEKRRRTPDGLLSLRARSPGSHEFYEILQKFKLCFILLGRLRLTLHNPKPSELIHMLFSPLTLCIQEIHNNMAATNNPQYGSREFDFARGVDAPLLTREAVQLLDDALNPTERQLWHMLGDAWRLNREQWGGALKTYMPTFTDGYNPYIPWLDPTGDGSNLGSESPLSPGGHDDFELFAQDIRRRRNPVAEAVVRYDGANTNELNLETGEVLEILERHDGWYKISNVQGHTGFVPSYTVRIRAIDQVDNISEQSFGEPPGSPPLSPRPILSPAAAPAKADHEYLEKPGRLDLATQRSFLDGIWKARSRAFDVTRSKEAQNAKELTVFEGEVVELVDDTSPNWWKVNAADGRAGWVPYTVLRELDNPRADDVFTSPIPAPPPPPPPAAPQPHRSVPVQSMALNAEFLNRINNGEIGVSNPVVVGPRIPRPAEVRPKPRLKLTAESTPDDVHNWLQANEFSPPTKRQYDGYNGAEMFAVKRHEMESVVREEEARRFWNMLNADKKLSGYETKSAAELNRMLEVQRKKFDKGGLVLTADDIVAQRQKLRTTGRPTISEEDENSTATSS